MIYVHFCSEVRKVTSIWKPTIFLGRALVTFITNLRGDDGKKVFFLCEVRVSFLP